MVEGEHANALPACTLSYAAFAAALASGESIAAFNAFAAAAPAAAAASGVRPDDAASPAAAAAAATASAEAPFPIAWGQVGRGQAQAGGVCMGQRLHLFSHATAHVVSHAGGVRN